MPPHGRGERSPGDVVLGAISTITDGDKARPMRMTDLFGGAGHREHLPEILDTHVHPGWPDLVQDYNEGRIPLEELGLPPVRSIP